MRRTDAKRNGGVGSSAAREAARIEALITRTEILEALLKEAASEATVLVTAFKRHRQTTTAAVPTSTSSVLQLRAMDA